MADFAIEATAAVLGGIIVYIIQRVFDGPLRDLLSIKKKEIKSVGNEHIEEITVKTSGTLSMKGRPIYIHNTGTIKSIVINQSQRDNVEIVHKSESEAVLIPKTLADPEITFETTSSGTTTASGTLNVK